MNEDNDNVAKQIQKLDDRLCQAEANLISVELERDELKKRHKNVCRRAESIRKELVAMIAKNERLRTALQPFAHCKNANGMCPDLKCGDCAGRHARAALDGKCCPRCGSPLGPNPCTCDGGAVGQVAEGKPSWGHNRPNPEMDSGSPRRG